ncbi:CCHC-type domain-containing protein [Abeliophyllum distichum]|uniref:CCHC-type domain-containing protein n=1 Tax=Abeliophyllum distichum TaxID=126358 RepID=A0ABD1VXI6_9LAMI
MVEGGAVVAYEEAVAENGHVYAINAVVSKNEWILDYGCTFYMCPCKEWFSEFLEINVGQVSMGNNYSFRTKGIGRMILHLGTGHELILDKIRVFGCATYAHQSEGKIEPMNAKYVFMGYAEVVKGYSGKKTWGDYKVIISRNVVFNKAEMPCIKDLKRNAELSDNDKSSIKSNMNLLVLNSSKNDQLQVELS